MSEKEMLTAQDLLDSENVETEVDENSEKYLTFFVNEQLYTIPSRNVIEIISMQPITYMPNLPVFVKGVINIRGKVVPLIDLQLRLKQTQGVYDEQTCIVVIELDDISVGFIVDRVHDVSDIYDSQISASPQVAKKDKERDFLEGIAKFDSQVAMILDIHKVLDDIKEEVVSA